MSSPEQIVREFCALMAGRDPEALRPFLADDAVYQNCGMEASAGVEAILANLAWQFDLIPDYGYEMKNIAAAGDVVLTERIDTMSSPTGPVGLPVMGTFVVRDGRIVRWTDYFDFALIAKISAGEQWSHLVPAAY